MTQSEPEICFGPYQLDMDNARLLREGRAVPLTPKSLQVLHHLASRPQKLVTKNDLLSAVWPDVIVSDASIKVCVREIRKALDDGAKTPTYIQTVHRRGYRFIGPTCPRVPSEDDRRLISVSEELSAHQEPLLASQFARSEPFVGRERELQWLKGIFQLARDDQRQCVFLAAGAGEGKTSLVNVFSRMLLEDADTESPCILVGHCFEQFGATEPYLPVWEAIGSVTRQRSSGSISGLLSRHAAAYASVASQADGSIASTASLTSERLLRDLVDAIESLARQTPLVLVLEDVHWADYSTIDLISALARRRTPARLMLVVTYRPDEILESEHPLQAVMAGLLTQGLAREMSLNHLDERAVAEFLVARFPASRLPRLLTRRLHQRTDGHPLFLIELVNDLVEQGVLAKRDEAWTFTGATGDQRSSDGRETPAWLAVLETQVPRTVRAMIEVHLARLAPEGREVLEAAAVAGVEFSAAAVAAAANIDVIAAEQLCHDLVRRQRFLEHRGQIEWPDGTIASHYRFAHELYHRVVYEQIPVARRAQLHRELALRVERAWGARASEEAAELAIHFETARDWGRALNYFRLAAQAAARQYAHRESAQYLQRALHAVDRLDPRQRAEHELEVLKSLAVNLQVTRGFAASEVQAIHARAYALCHAPGSSDAAYISRTFPVLWGIWVFHKVRSDLRTARQMCDELLALAGDDTSLRLQAHQAMCVTHLCLGNPRAAVEHLEHVRAIYDPIVHAGNTESFGQDPGVATLAFGAVALFLLGRAAEAREASRRSLELARELHQPSSLALSLHFAAMLHQLCGDAMETETCAQEAFAIASEEGFSFWRAGSLIMRGWARVAGARLLPCHDPAAGLEDIHHGLDGWLATGSRTYHTYFLGLLADALLRLNRPAEAIQTLDEAIAMAGALPEGLYEAELHRLKGSSLLQTPQASAARDAREAFTQPLELARSQGARTFEQKTSADLAALMQLRRETIQPNQLLSTTA